MNETYYSYETTFNPTILIIAGIIGLIQIISLWKIFQKAGQPGWAAIIPIYNTYIMIKISGKSGWWLLLLLIPLVNIVILIMLLYYFSKSFGQSGAFVLGLLFLSFIFYPILAFGNAKYVGPYGNPAAFAAYQQHQFEFEQNHGQSS